VITQAAGARLAELYAGNLKHAGYQPVPQVLAGHLPEPDIDPLWRDPRPRLPLLRAGLHAAPDGPTVVEIGANTGYNTLTLAAELPRRRFVAVEASAPHAEFIAECARLLGLDNVSVLAEGVLPEDVSRRWPDSEVLDFNVAHHLGVDIAVEGVNDVASWWSHGLPDWLATADRHPAYWFCVGYRWGGSREHELHDPDDAEGMVARILAAAPPTLVPADTWVAVGDGHAVRYLRQGGTDGTDGLNEVIRRESAAGHYRGEYFRRPILRFRPR